MVIENQQHLISMVLIVIAAIIPVYLTFRLKSNLRKLTLLLMIFVVVHSIYHFFGALGFEFLAEDIFEPASAGALILFGLAFLNEVGGGKENKYRISTYTAAAGAAMGLSALVNNHIPTIILLSIAIMIFVWLAVKSKNNIKSFQFQTSIFIVVWVIGEIAGVLEESSVIRLSIPEDIGLNIHLASMTFFCLMVWFRFYLSKRSGRVMIDNIEDYPA